MLNCHRTKLQQAFDQIRPVRVSEAIVERLARHTILGGAIEGFSSL